MSSNQILHFIFNLLFPSFFSVQTNSSMQPKKRIKRNQLNFDVCCPINNEIEITKSLQQIRADESEIKRRINCFINRKREEINNYNKQDFIKDDAVAMNDENESTCARVNCVAYRAKDSKSHLKVHRVINEYGPQTTNYKNALDKLMENTPQIKSDPDAIAVIPINIQERLTNIESHLNIPTNRSIIKSIFDRIKIVENKILYLEALSPEYTHFLVSFFMIHIIFN